MRSEKEMESTRKWYAIKCIFEVPAREELGKHLYEERVLLWKAESFEEAFEFAKKEAKEYEKEAEGISFIGRSDAYEIDHDIIGHGSELWSHQRGSNFEPHNYVRTFIDTEKEVGYEIDK